MKALFAKIVVCLCCLIFLLTGMQCYFVPDQTLQLFSISYADSAGLSTIRGDLGGLFLSIFSFLLLGLRAGQRHWLMAANLIILLIVVGRVIGMVMDELTQHLISITALELVIVAFIWGACRILKQEDNEAALAQA